MAMSLIGGMPSNLVSESFISKLNLISNTIKEHFGKKVDIKHQENINRIEGKIEKIKKDIEEAQRSFDEIIRNFNFHYDAFINRMKRELNNAHIQSKLPQYLSKLGNIVTYITSHGIHSINEVEEKEKEIKKLKEEIKKEINSKGNILQRLLWIVDQYDNIFQNLIGKELKSKVLNKMIDIKKELDNLEKEIKNIDVKNNDKLKKEIEKEINELKKELEKLYKSLEEFIKYLSHILNV
jgi:DNA repair exonuclease SbcCD ATPase subunit